MLRQLLIAGIIIQSILLVLLVAFRFMESAPEPTITQPPPVQNIPSEPPKPQPLPELVQTINERNKQIKSFSCDDITIKTWERGMKFRLEATVSYEKDLNFRMILASTFGKELDLGSNQELFWYWSRRDKHPGLYWALHEDFYKTRLKTPFNPMFMRDTLGLNEIKQEGAQIIENDKDIMVVYQQTNSMGDPILYTVVVDKEGKEIKGILITDMQGKALALAEIREHHNGLPVQILYNWYEENKVLLLEFHNPKVNLRIASTSWQPPNEKPKINMANE